MSGVTILWSMVASACLTLAVVHGLVWWRSREARASGIFALSAVGTAFLAGCELWMMRAGTAAEFGVALRWLHVPAWAVIVALVVFIRLHLQAGRPWLAWTVCGVRTLSLILNFVFSPNLNFRQINGLRHIQFLGEPVAVADGVPNPWMLVGQASFLLLLVFVVDAMITVWRRGDRLPLRLLSCAIVLFFLLSIGQAVLSLWGIVDTPITASLFFMGIVMAMGFELSAGVIRGAELSAELRESEERLGLAAAAGRLGLWVWDIRKDEIWITPEGRALFGFKPDERVDSRRFLEAVLPEDREVVNQAVAKSLRDDAEYEREYRVLLADGRIRWVNARGRVERDTQGQAARVRGVAVDISQRKSAEREVSEQRDALAHLSRITTLGELSGALAHELNQPLAAMLSNAQVGRRSLTRGQPDMAELGAIFDDIADDAKRAGGIIHGMRAMFKKDAAARPLPVDLNEMVTAVLSLVRAGIVSSKVKLDLNLADALPRALAGGVEIQQVLMNLLLNSLDALESSDAPGCIEIATAQKGGEVIVTVRDSGSGIPPEIMRRLFEPFTTSKAGGLGLGLVISRRIVERFGGKLVAGNHPDGGAVFCMTLPVAAA